MIKKNMSINVLYTSDNGYAPWTGISICSLLENNKNCKEINIYYIYENVSKENLARLSNMVKKYQTNEKKRNLIIRDGKKFSEQMKILNVAEYRGCQAANYRLFFDEYIDTTIDKILYLDSDTLVVGEVESLFQLDFEDKCAGVVQDSLGGDYKQIIGFNKDEIYFNSGVIMFVVSNWRKMNCKERLLNIIKNPQNRYPNPDQDYLNILLKDKVKILNLRYNLQPVHQVYSIEDYFRSYPAVNYYLPEEIEDAVAEPIILHAYRFLGQFPWYENNLHPNKNIFEYYKEISEWKDIPLKKDLSVFFEVEKMIYKFLPHKIFLLIFSKFQLCEFKRKKKRMQR